MKKNYILIATLMSVSLTAMAQTNVLTVTETKTKIEAGDAGDYYRVNDLWHMDAGKTYLLSLPAHLDGYYFGPRAERREVTNYEKQSDGTFVVSFNDMADMADFEPNKAYLITPTINVDTIAHITPGIKTNAPLTAEGKELLHANVVDGSKFIDGIPNIENDNTISSGAHAIYDLKGRKVSGLRKGETYIVNGNKIRIK